MPLTLDALTLLDAIERRGSFARAAEEMERAPSSLTYAVQQMEADLDLLVFDRSGYRARLTPAGRVLLEEGRVLLKAAAETEARARLAAEGWEPSLTLALDVALPMAPVLDCVAELGEMVQKTAIRIRSEVLAGTWEALLSGRADLAVGVSGEGPPGGGVRTRALGRLEFVFCVAPKHPLAKLQAPLTEADVQAHCAVVISDTARNLPLRTTGVLQRQTRLAVPDLAAKLIAQQKGLGVGNLPRWAVEPELSSGRLVEQAMAGGNQIETLYLAWRGGESGRALAWFIQRLSRPDAFKGIFVSNPTIKNSVY